MARAYRHFIPGYVWHITHRCHRREFLFKFAKDRTRWMELLFEARRPYRLSIPNFIVTFNHIHLVVASPKKRESIPQAMQLVAGRTAQAYNRRKGRKGAFWQDRYHATAIETGDHLWRCLVPMLPKLKIPFAVSASLFMHRSYVTVIHIYPAGEYISR